VAGIAIAFAATGGIFAGLFLPRTLRLTGRFFGLLAIYSG